MYHPFSVAETIKTSWILLKRNFAVISVFFIIGFVVALVSAFVVYNIFIGTVLKTVGFFVLLIEISYLFLGLIRLIFRLLDKEYYDFEIGDIIPKIRMVGSYLILLILISAFIVFLTAGVSHMHDGSLKKILGVLLGGLVQFFLVFYFPICTCFMVDDESGPFESVTQSFHLIKGNYLKYFLLFIFVEALIFVGSITVIGILVTYPLVNVILVVAYRKLVYSHQDVDDDLSETN